MSLARVHTRAIVGVEAPPVAVEVDISGGLPSFNLVGLPETAVRESRDRVRAALLNAGFEFPQRRITVSLAPADLPKEGGRFDLPIALGVLAASSQLPAEGLDTCEFAGELALSGELRAVTGALPLDPDLADVSGQHHARRAVEIAAAGGHNLLFVGPPGSGKSMLASRLPGLLPRLDTETALESAAVHSVSVGFDPTHWSRPPFRHPHHTVSGVALVGGGALAQPGEASLAHGGVLFLDELAEFPRAVLDVLREPLESGEIHVSRARRRARYPARFQLVAAMNPCPCGYFGDSTRACRCTAEQVQRYQGRVSGPLLDRIDLHIRVPAIPYASLRQEKPGESTACVSHRVEAAQAVQRRRQNRLNAHLAANQMAEHCSLSKECERFFETAVERLGLSLRSCHRVLRVARTIADLAGSDSIRREDLGESIGFRQ